MKGWIIVTINFNMANWIFQSTPITLILANRGVRPAVTWTVFGFLSEFELLGFYCIWNCVRSLSFWDGGLRDCDIIFKDQIYHTSLSSTVPSFRSFLLFRSFPFLDLSLVKYINLSGFIPLNKRTERFATQYACTYLGGLFVYFIWDYRVYHFLAAS